MIDLPNIDDLLRANGYGFDRDEPATHVHYSGDKHGVVIEAHEVATIHDVLFLVARDCANRFGGIRPALAALTAGMWPVEGSACRYAYRLPCLRFGY